MKKQEIISSFKNTMSRVEFSLRKNSPEIVIAVSIVGAVTSTVLACKATIKAKDIWDEKNEDLEKVKEASEEKQEEYTPEDAKKDTATIYIQTGVKLAKLYAPSVALGTLSISGIVLSHDILKGRNVALAAAYATLDKSFKEYRNRISERFGEQTEHEIRFGTKETEITEQTEDEDGKKKKVKKTIDILDDEGCSIEYSDYARFFDSGSCHWEKDSEYNLMFLRAQQNYANDILRSKGYLFLNDVYDMLGIPRSKAGQVVGWRYDRKNPTGDNFVDFGIYQANRANRDFVNGYEPVILLDFNVDGNIWNDMNNYI